MNAKFFVNLHAKTNLHGRESRSAYRYRREQVEESRGSREHRSG